MHEIVSSFVWLQSVCLRTSSGDLAVQSCFLINTVDAKWTNLLEFLKKKKKEKKKKEKKKRVWGQLPRVHTLHKEKNALEKERLIQTYVCFSFHEELQIIMMKDGSENYRLYLVLLVCAKLQALEVWKWNFGRFFTPIFSLNCFFKLFAKEAGAQGRNRAQALKFGEILWKLIKV